ncbi:hypothetical protein G7Y89_g4968 [Cudoniella acicularis]|uniref:Uncharacterized protein n=1 Tax=Cudoniella acicularis TaxID=354080 RepID=A0A8H4RNE1_9HELO|nr:hypothetical protein G7Y89_g4968 [Cudoniella acicularis]
MSMSVSPTRDSIRTISTKLYLDATQQTIQGGHAAAMTMYQISVVLWEQANLLAGTLEPYPLPLPSNLAPSTSSGSAALQSQQAAKTSSFDTAQSPRPRALIPPGPPFSLTQPSADTPSTSTKADDKAHALCHPPSTTAITYPRKRQPNTPLAQFATAASLTPPPTPHLPMRLALEREWRHRHNGTVILPLGYQPSFGWNFDGMPKFSSFATIKNAEAAASGTNMANWHAMRRLTGPNLVIRFYKTSTRPSDLLLWVCSTCWGKPPKLTPQRIAAINHVLAFLRYWSNTNYHGDTAQMMHVCWAQWISRNSLSGTLAAIWRD